MHPQHGPVPQPPIGYPPPPGSPGHWSPPPPPTRRGRIVTAAAAALSAAVVGVGGFVAYHHTLGTKKPTCAVDGARTITMRHNVKSGEPKIRVPALRGWAEPNYEDPVTKRHDYPQLRGYISNLNLRENGFTPTIEIDLAQSDSSVSEETAVEQTLSAVARNSRVVSRSVETICGATVYRTDISEFRSETEDPPLDGMVLVTAKERSDGPNWISAAVILTTNPNRPEYVKQREALLRGFHLDDTTNT